MSKDSGPAQLRAHYGSPSGGTHAFEVAVERPAASASENGGASETRAKSAYLNGLRASVAQLQDQVNRFLTQKMEDDRAAAALNGGALDEKKEEENYGEEVVEED